MNPRLTNPHRLSKASGPERRRAGGVGEAHSRGRGRTRRGIRANAAPERHRGMGLNQVRDSTSASSMCEDGRPTTSLLWSKGNRKLPPSRPCGLKETWALFFSVRQLQCVLIWRRAIVASIFLGEVGTAACCWPGRVVPLRMAHRDEVKCGIHDLLGNKGERTGSDDAFSTYHRRLSRHRAPGHHNAKMMKRLVEYEATPSMVPMPSSDSDFRSLPS